jgi:Predicted metal-dependent hydrolase with the TIM-barrel fold
MKTSKKLLFAFITITLLQACNRTKIEADLILKNGTIYTVDSCFSKAECLAVKDGKFIAIGDTKEILRKYEAEEIIDASGQYIYPGFMDGHCHFVGYGENLVRWADLRGCTSFEEVIERLQQHQSQNPSEWLLGRGWDQNLWKKTVFPTNDTLATVFPGEKVILTRIDGHALLASDEVLALASLDGKSIIEGGKVMTENGRPTGILLDKAADMIREMIPECNTEEESKAILLAQKNCFAVGLTNVTDAGLKSYIIKMIDSLQQEGALKMNINAMINPDEESLKLFMSHGPIVKEKLTIRSVKLYADGALGSRGAKLLEPYSDAPETSGLMTEENDFYRNICERAKTAGFQVCTHAIGDAAVRNILEIYSKALEGNNDLRWRIEHSQVVNPKDFALYRQYSIIPSIQSTHCTSDMGWAKERLGTERLSTSYAQKTLLKQNGWIVNGTDFPIEDINPLYTFYAAVFRQNLKGEPKEGFQMENALSRADALRSITIWVAKGYFAEKRKGSIEIGKDADFVMLENDIMTCDGKLIPNTKVTETRVEGEKVYSIKD